MNPRIKTLISESILVKQQLLRDEALLRTIDQVAQTMTIALKGGKKILFCGNGGSASDAQHLAAELSGRFYFDREPLYAEALHVNSSALTAIANDYGYEEVFARMIGAKGQEGDVLVALSTSGNSPNILRAIQEAKKRFLVVIGMTAATGGKMAPHCDYLIKVPTQDTMRCQESHIMIGHLLCELVEAAIFRPGTTRSA
ncbi:MAG: D-sedoheptulose 7-phosphate isomerase [Bacteroidota bacterium]